MKNKILNGMYNKFTQSSITGIPTESKLYRTNQRTPVKHATENMSQIWEIWLANHEKCDLGNDIRTILYVTFPWCTVIDHKIRNNSFRKRIS